MENKLLIPKNAKQIFIPGLVGKLECLKLVPLNSEIRGVAIICHPNPLDGGTYTNKIVQVLAKSLNQFGYICYCPHVRGVGMSEGEFVAKDALFDIESVHSFIREEFPDLDLILSGFSFGTYLVSELAQKIPHKKLILVGTAVKSYPEITAIDSAKTIVIHGDMDEITPFNTILSWGKKHNQPIICMPNTGHFFHGKLIELQNKINEF